MSNTTTTAGANTTATTTTTAATTTQAITGAFINGFVKGTSRTLYILSGVTHLVADVTDRVEDYAVEGVATTSRAIFRDSMNDWCSTAWEEGVKTDAEICTIAKEYKNKSSKYINDFKFSNEEEL